MWITLGAHWRKKSDAGDPFYGGGCISSLTYGSPRLLMLIQYTARERPCLMTVRVHKTSLLRSDLNKLVFHEGFTKPLMEVRSSTLSYREGFMRGLRNPSLLALSTKCREEVRLPPFFSFVFFLQKPLLILRKRDYVCCHNVRSDNDVPFYEGFTKPLIENGRLS